MPRTPGAPMVARRGHRQAASVLLYYMLPLGLCNKEVASIAWYQGLFMSPPATRATDPISIDLFVALFIHRVPLNSQMHPSRNRSSRGLLNYGDHI